MLFQYVGSPEFAKPSGGTVLLLNPFREVRSQIIAVKDHRLYKAWGKINHDFLKEHFCAS